MPRSKESPSSNIVIPENIKWQVGMWGKAMLNERHEPGIDGLKHTRTTYLAHFDPGSGSAPLFGYLVADSHKLRRMLDFREIDVYPPYVNTNAFRIPLAVNLDVDDLNNLWKNTSFNEQIGFNLMSNDAQSAAFSTEQLAASRQAEADVFLANFANRNINLILALTNNIIGSLYKSVNPVKAENMQDEQVRNYSIGTEYNNAFDGENKIDYKTKVGIVRLDKTIRMPHGVFYPLVGYKISQLLQNKMPNMQVSPVDVSEFFNYLTKIFLR